MQCGPALGRGERRIEARVSHSLRGRWSIREDRLRNTVSPVAEKAGYKTMDTFAGESSYHRHLEPLMRCCGAKWLICNCPRRMPPSPPHVSTAFTAARRPWRSDRGSRALEILGHKIVKTQKSTARNSRPNYNYASLNTAILSLGLGSPVSFCTR
jgi:hypothetical protein